jgi:hypothetical protein
MRAVLFSAWKLPDPMYGYGSIPTHIEKCLASALLPSSPRAVQAERADRNFHHGFSSEGFVTFARRQFLHLAAGAAALSAARVGAQTYPARPIRLLVPVAPGGVLDIVARSWADKMRTVLGTVVIENHPGGGGSLRAAAVAHARPDGYTILLRIIDPFDGVATQEPTAL